MPPQSMETGGTMKPGSSQVGLGRPSDEDILNYENRIREEQVNVHPLISPRLPISILREEYLHSSNANFLRKMDELVRDFGSLRRTRGDGNCFFRAFSYGLIEQVHQIRDSSSWISHLKQRLGSQLQEAGFDSLAYEDFFEELFNTLNDPQVTSQSDYLAELWAAEPHRSHSLIVILRLATSAYLRAHTSTYEPFLWDCTSATSTEAVDMVQYCQRYVECLGVESDQIHAIALGKALGVDIEIVYLDGSEGPLSKLLFRASDEEERNTPLKVTLLYRPGHYDLLYIGEKSAGREASLLSTSGKVKFT